MILEKFQVAIPTAFSEKLSESFSENFNESFNENEGLDIPKTLALATHLVKLGVKSLLVCGTTGEQHSLSFAEKVQLLEAFDGFQVQNKDVQVVFGISAVRQVEALEVAKLISKSTIFGSLLAFPPYIRPTQAEAMFYAKSIIETINKPVVLYNNPARTGFSLNVENIVELSKYKNVLGLKEAGNPEFIPQLKQCITKPFLYYAGGELDLWTKIELGYNALSSIGGNLHPQLGIDTLESYSSGDKEQAKKHCEEFWQKISFLYEGSTISNLKHALKEQNLDVGIPRSPIGSA